MLTREDLAKLPREDLLKIAKKLGDIDQAQQRRKLEAYLETANPPQIEFHKAPQRFRLFIGGNRTGKSTGGGAESNWLATGTHPYRKITVPNKGLIVGNDFENSIRDVIWPKLQNLAPLGVIAETEKNQNGVVKHVKYRTGSTIDFKSHDQSIKIFESSDYDWVWFDEPPPRNIWTAVLRGLTDRGGIAFFTLTPISEPWIYELYERSKKNTENYWSICASTYENAKNIGEGDEELGKRRIKEFEEDLSEEEKAARIQGQFAHLQGRVFKDWNRGHHLIQPFPWPVSWPIYESIDPHPRKPWAISWIGVTESKTKILLKSILSDGVVEDVAKDILEARMSLDIENNHRTRIARTFIDNYASVESMIGTKKPIKDTLEEYIGPRSGGARIEVCPKDVMQKITIMKEWLKIKKTSFGERADFYVFDNGENEQFIFEIEHYVWDRYRNRNKIGYKDAPRKENDDILDTIMQLCLVNIDNSFDTQPVRIRSTRYTTYGGRGEIDG